MDVQICALLSAIEAMGLVCLQESLSPAGEFRGRLLKAFAVLVLSQYMLLKIFRTFVQPIYLSPLRHLPTPKGGHFMLGQLLNQYRAPRPDALWLEWAARWPDSPLVRHFGLANAEVLLVNGVEAHREVLQTRCHAFRKPASFARLVGEIAGAGLIFAEGEEHTRQRKMIMNVFSLPNLKKTLPVFLDKAGDLAGFLNRKVVENPTGTIEMYDAFSKATIDIIGVTSLGIELRNLRSDTLDLDFLQIYEKLLAPSYASALISFINVAVPVRRLLWFVPANREFVEATRELRAMLRRCIQDRVRDVAASEKQAGEPESRNLLTYMVEEMLTGGQPLTVDLMLEHLLNFLAAGHETVASTMVWASYVLATKPDIQDRLRAEIRTTLGETPTPGYAEIERMHYMDNFVKELIRVYSPAIATQREAAQDVVICGTRIPKGTALVLSPPTVNTSARVWGADAAEFAPERWDRLEGGEAGSAYSVLSFLAGPRVCIGRRYALLEIKALLLRLVADFRFAPGEELERCGLEVPVRNPNIVLRPRDGLRLRLERI
ncbi:hypothetical protein RB595_008582 [Gaeumannomyces hyphopodioides]